MSKRARLLYVFEERIPKALRTLVEERIPKDEFKIQRMTYTTPDSEKKKLLGWAEVVLFAPGRYLSDEILQSAKGKVRLMQLWSSGYDKFNTAGAARVGVPVANNGGANAISVAEHTILLMLSVSKWLPESHMRAVHGRWAGNSHGLDMFLLHGKTLGIFGFGNIGRNVARRCSSFGMRILYHDISPAPEEVVKETGARLVDQKTLLRESDILTLHLHYSRDTERIVDERAIALMKPGAVLINVSRAQLVDKEALLSALRNGRIRGAGIDVFDQEPTLPGDSLLSLPNVVATPHIGGSTFDTYCMAMEHCVSNCRRAIEGEKPFWVVNGVA